MSFRFIYSVPSRVCSSFLNTSSSLHMVQHLYGTVTPTATPAAAAAAAAGAKGDPTANESTPSAVRLTAHNQYISPRLLRDHLPAEPLGLFRTWLTDALRPPMGVPPVHEPEAMTVSTATSTGIPSSRIVLLKEVDETGFVFYTNYNSRKSGELAANPFASLAFYWREVSRQVRVVGKVEKVSRDESERYFASRPRGSQIGAWASEQSQPVGENDLAARVQVMEDKFEGQQVACPDHWGGWRVVPFEVEFWSGQPSRLHDRFRYTRPEGGKWVVHRLSP